MQVKHFKSFDLDELENEVNSFLDEIEATLAPDSAMSASYDVKSYLIPVQRQDTKLVNANNQPTMDMAFVHIASLSFDIGTHMGDPDGGTGEEDEE